MEEALYPERNRHKSAHDLFMQDFHQLIGDVEANRLSTANAEWVGARVVEWLKFHIQVNDVPLGRYLE